MLQLYLIAIPKQSVFEQNIDLLKQYVFPFEYEMLKVKNQANIASILSKIGIRYLAMKHTMSKTIFPFSIEKNGKPYFEGISDFQFNISHTKNYIAIGIDTIPLGIDIESFRVYRPQVVARFFHPKEYETIETESLQERKNLLFTQLWTLKESYVKYLGTGIANYFHRFSISIMNDQDIKISGVQENIFFKQYIIENEYYLSVCSSRNDFPENIFFLNFEEILNIKL